MTTLIEFLTARLDEDEAAALAAAKAAENGYNTEPAWEYDGEEVITAGGRGIVTGPWGIEAEIARYIERNQPARVLREVAAKRRVLERHCQYDGTALHVYCAGCSTGDETGYPDTKLKDCPELQDLAFIWNEHEDWNQEWCPHVEGRHEEDVTEVPPARGCYTNACNRCGQGDGWHYRKDRVT